MAVALAEAQKALNKDEVPVGAIVVQNDEIIGRGHNLVESLQDPTAHAEMLAITAASNATASWRLDDAIIYTTLEPCPMCAGAILLARIKTVVYGTKDPRFGACGSKIKVIQNTDLSTDTEVIDGIMNEECSSLLKKFFEKLRDEPYQ